ncbi:MAG TPA: hypothetical protein EYO58_11825, partial [Flavobacteriales bacterium]|nr:hypothetical protein [Flavobacteriales bacterium]
MQNTKPFILLDTKSIVGTNVPIQGTTKHKIKLPNELSTQIQISSLSQTRQDTSPMMTFYREHYNQQTDIYQLVFDIPLLQISKSQQNIDNPTPNHMFLHVHINGHYERKLISSYCRGEQIDAQVIVFPVFMNEMEQARVLRKLPFGDNAKTAVDTLRKNHSYLN